MENSWPQKKEGLPGHDLGSCSCGYCWHARGINQGIEACTKSLEGQTLRPELENAVCKHYIAYGFCKKCFPNGLEGQRGKLTLTVLEEKYSEAMEHIKYLMACIKDRDEQIEKSFATSKSDIDEKELLNLITEYAFNPKNQYLDTAKLTKEIFAKFSGHSAKPAASLSPENASLLKFTECEHKKQDILDADCPACNMAWCLERIKYLEGHSAKAGLK